MLKRLITAAVGVVGLVVVGLGVASATVWRADDVLVAAATGDAAVVITEPGVLELGGDPATVTVTAPDEAPLVVAVGRDSDVVGWVGDDAHTTVTGLSDWHTLAVEEVAAVAPEPDATEDAAADPAAETPPADAAAEDPAADADAGSDDAGAVQPVTVADPTGSDLWVAEATGNGSVELEWPAQEGRWSLVAVSTTGTAPTVQLAWPRTVTTPWLWPCVVVGGLLVLGALVVALRGIRRRRAPEPAWTPVTTGSIPVVGATPSRPLTRRELREAAARGESAAPTAPDAPPAAPTQAAAVGGPRGAGLVPGPATTPPAPPQPGDDTSQSARAGAPWAPSSRRSRREPAAAGPPGAPGGPASPSGGPQQVAGDDDTHTTPGTRSQWPRSVGGAAPQGGAPSDLPTVTDGPAHGGAPTPDFGRGPWPGAASSAGAAPETAGPRTSAANGRPSWAPRGGAQPAAAGPGAVAGAGAGAARPVVPPGPPAPPGAPSGSGPVPPSEPDVAGRQPSQPAPRPTSQPAGAGPEGVTVGRSVRRQPAGPVPAQAGPDAPTAPGLGGRPGGWSPTLPPPGATVRPGATGGPDAPHTAAGRPTWLAGGPAPVAHGPGQGVGPDGGRGPAGTVPPSPAPPAPSAPRTQQPGADPDAAAARADAWRRAWGLPPGAGTQGQGQQEPSEEEQR